MARSAPVTMTGVLHILKTVLLVGMVVYAAQGQSWPILVFGEGETATIPCLPQGQANTFFWRKGDLFNNSAQVAYNVEGKTGPSTEKFLVLTNGSLVIKNITLKDEGNYFCRITSDISDCHGGVKVFIKVPIASNFPSIDRCVLPSGCTIYEEPFSVVFLTCKGRLISPFMSLKWYHGSQEVTENVTVIRNSNAMNETVLSSSIQIHYEKPLFLTCEASDEKIERALAHVQLDSKPDKNTPVRLIVITVVVAITCALLAGILLAKVIKWRNQKPDETVSAEDNTAREKPNKISAVIEEENLLQESTKEVPQSTRNELDRTKSDLKSTKEKLKSTQKLLKLKEEELNSEKAKFKERLIVNELQQRQRRFMLLDKVDNCRTLCRIKSCQRKAKTFINHVGTTALTTTGSEYHYSYIFPKDASREKVFSELEYLVKNSIDGRSSIICVHGNSRDGILHLMYDSKNKYDEGVIIRAFRKMLKTSGKWNEIDLTLEVRIVCVSAVPDNRNVFMFSSLDNNTGALMLNDISFIKDDRDSAFTARTVTITSTEQVERLLNKHIKEIVKPPGLDFATQNFVQFFITTKTKTTTVSTGTLAFSSFTEIEKMKECFDNTRRERSKIAHYLHSGMNAEETKIAILTNIHEENKEECKVHLKFNEWMNDQSKGIPTKPLR